MEERALHRRHQFAREACLATQERRLPGFTKKYNCHFLVYFEEYGRIEQAIAREKEIKGWVRVKKNALIATMNPEWKDLAADWYALSS